MKQTTVGLPNTCSQCGQLAEPHWYAPNEDAARAGAGICESCKNPAPKKPAKEEKPKKPEAKESKEAETSKELEGEAEKE